MKLYVGVTDGDWFRFLKEQKPDEVNFWRPSTAGGGFGAVEPGSPFLFKLHSPDNFIAGGGYFLRYVSAPLSQVWPAFGPKNGAPDELTFRRRILGYRTRRDSSAAPAVEGYPQRPRNPVPSPIGPDPEVGCIILTQPFFFKRADWIEAPSDWSGSIQRGKTYDTLIGEGRRVWSEVRARLEGVKGEVSPSIIRELTATDGALHGGKYLATARLGQGAFRLMTLENYERRCCITGEKTVPVLEAAHIHPVAADGNHALSNGLLLRADMHILYDKGLIGVDPDYRIRVSPQIREQYVNGKVYYEHEGKVLRSLPSVEALRPDRELLGWHMDEVFVA